MDAKAGAQAAYFGTIDEIVKEACRDPGSVDLDRKLGGIFKLHPISDQNPLDEPAIRRAFANAITKRGEF